MGGGLETQGGNGTPPWFCDREQRQPLPLKNQERRQLHCSWKHCAARYNTQTPMKLINLLADIDDDIQHISIQNKARARILVVMLCNQEHCHDKAYQSGNMGVGDTACVLAHVFLWRIPILKPHLPLSSTSPREARFPSNLMIQWVMAGLVRWTCN